MDGDVPYWIGLGFLLETLKVELLSWYGWLSLRGVVLRWCSSEWEGQLHRFPQQLGEGCPTWDFADAVQWTDGSSSRGQRERVKLGSETVGDT